MKKEAMPLEFVQKVKDTINKQDFVEGEIKKKSEDGKEFWIHNKVMPIYDDHNNQIGEVIVNYDITEKKKFEKLAITDGLTGLYNRRFFNQILTREVARASRNKSLLSFLILDIDYFKKYNDSYGHDLGDKALMKVGETLKELTHRGSDFAFRLGGEEFGVLFSNADKEASLSFANKIRDAIYERKISHSNSTVAKYISVSVGLIVVDFSLESVDEHGFYTMADDALYEAKESGRNRVVLYENDDLEFF